MKINSANFLTWYNSASYEPLPLRNKKCAYGTVCWAVSEEISFIVNAPIGVPLSGVVSLAICSLDKTFVSSLGNTSYFTGEVYGGIYHYKTTTCPVLPESYYILRLTSGSSVYYSSPILILNGSEKENTILFKFRHKFAKNNVEYTHASLANFYQKFRVYGVITDLDNSMTKEIITDSDSIKPREYNHKIDYSYKGTLFNLDLDLHQACHDMFSSSELYMNDLLVQTKDAYSANSLRVDGLSNGNFNVTDYNLRYSKRV